jgi:laminin, alpha 3/5
MKFSSILSYQPHSNGYLKMRNFTVGNKLHINLKFKTRQEKGIIFFGMSNDQTATFSLALESGILVLRSSKFELNSGSDTFNDGEWHVVTATHDERRLRLSVDDSYFYSTEDAPPPLYINFGEIYYGGFPKNFKAVRGALPNDAYFVGCIQDVTMNTQQVNFALSNDKQYATLNNCARDLFGEF